MVIDGSVCSPRGFLASGIRAGFKISGKLDAAMVYSQAPCKVSAAFTSNLFCAAPVIYDRELISRKGMVRAAFINSGNANACTGDRGLADARETAKLVAAKLQISPDEVLLSSTGHIGDFLQMDIVKKGVELAAEALSEQGGQLAAQAIMTTDTVPKSFAVQIQIGGKTVTLGGMTKGAGMICPRLKPVRQATMLCYVTTDANITQEALDTALANTLDGSFNRITVDGDTSTNDTFVVMANGQAQNDEIKKDTAEAQLFAQALTELAGRLAKEMVKDGEGVSRFVEVQVLGARTPQEARICAESIAKSPLCKTAWFGADPNWGRILCAAGYSGIQFDPMKVDLDIQGAPVVRGGMDPHLTTLEDLNELVKAPELNIVLNLNAGQGEFTIWTCDLTYDYVKINADYRT